MHGRLGRALDQQIDRREAVEILRVADIAVNKPDAAGPQARQRQLAAAPVQIV